MRKYTLNENYFDTLDSEDKAYFLGYLMADGYNNESRGAIEASCSVKDKEFLEMLNKAIGSSKPIRLVQEKKNSYRMSLCGKHLSQRLSDLGCMQKKTFKLVFPNYLNEEMKRHFIRGYFDGDGCISYTFAKRNNYFGNSFLSVATITSTESFCLYLKRYIKSILNVNSTMLCRHPSHNNNNRTLQISGNKQVIRFAEWMYKSANLFLKRKFDKIEIIKKTIDKRDIIVHDLRKKNGTKIIMEVNRRRIKNASPA